MTRGNEHVNGLSPVIVSASRSTDIPAFYADWFVERLREGWCSWINPFNRQKFRVSFDRTRMIVFWSKNPKPLLDRLGEIESLGFRNYYFQFTLNDYVREGLEPNVPPLEERIDTFKRLSDRVGKERVIWRYDPLLLTDTVSVDTLVDRIATIGRQLRGYTEKLVFSFIDIADYRKVKNNLAKLDCREFTNGDHVPFARGLSDLNRELGFELATCGELADLDMYGIKHNKCIDDGLIMRLFHDDPALMEFIGAEYDMFNGWQIKKSKKDKGQREACGCIPSKDIGMYNTCPHVCKYCYANTSAAAAMANWKQHRQRPHTETITGDE